MTAISIGLLRVLLTNSMLDEFDVEILERRLMSFEYPSALSFSPFAYLAIAGAVIADGNIGFYGIILLLLSPVVFMGMMEVLKDYFLRALLSYVDALSKYDSTFRRAISSLRSREITLYRLRSDHYIVVNRCLRPLRCKLLAMLRSEVQDLIALLKPICWDCDSEFLLCNMLDPQISELALTDDVRDKFLELSSLRELRQVYHLLTGEFFRYFLLHLSQPSYKVVLIMPTVIRKTTEITDKKIRLLSELKNLIPEGDCLVDNRHSVRIGTVQAYLSFAAEVLSENGLRNEVKFHRVVKILQETYHLLTDRSPSELGEESGSGGTVAEIPESMENLPLPLPEQSNGSRQVSMDLAARSNENGGIINLNGTEEVYEADSRPIASDEGVSNEPTPPEKLDQPSEEAKMVTGELKAYLRRQHVRSDRADLNGVRVQGRTTAVGQQNYGYANHYSQQGGGNGNSDAWEFQGTSDYQQEENNDKRWGNGKRSSANEEKVSIANVPANDYSAQSQFERTVIELYERQPTFFTYSSQS